MKNNTGYFLKQIFNNADKLKNNMLIDTELTSSQVDILLYLLHVKEKNVNQRDIEKHFKYSNASVSKMIDRLVEKGLIVKEISKKDSRSKNIILTNKAISLKQQMKENIIEFEKILLKGIKPEDVEYLNNLLNSININLNNELMKGAKNNENIENT